MSNSTAAPSTAGHTPVKPLHGGQHAHKKAGGDAPADLFSNLMSLVSATHSEPAPDLPEQDTTGDPRQPGAENPVHALLNWASPAALAATATANAALAGGTAPAAHTALAGQANAASQGIDLTGMTPLGAGTPLDPETSAALALANAPTASSTSLQTAQSALAEALNDHSKNSLAEHATGTKTDAGDALGKASERMGAEGMRPTDPGRSGAAPALGTRSSTVNGSWRKAPVHAAATTAQEVGSLRALATDGMAGRLVAQAPLMRSTVAMHERLGQAGTSLAAAPASANEGSALNTTGLRPAGAPGAEAPASAAGAAIADLLDSGSQPDALSAEDAAQELAQPDPLADPEAEQISHWSAQNLRHASLRVGKGGEDAIDIQLTMSGQEVRVDFRTDNAEARASLQQGADASLGELLQRSGIQLGDVSVGAQGQRQDSAERRSPAPASLRQQAETAAEPLASPAISRPRADGSQPLDVFA